VVLSGNPLQSNWGSAYLNISQIKQIAAILDSNAVGRSSGSELNQ
jgi:hypothetical protein